MTKEDDAPIIGAALFAFCVIVIVAMIAWAV